MPPPFPLQAIIRTHGEVVWLGVFWVFPVLAAAARRGKETMVIKVSQVG